MRKDANAHGSDLALERTTLELINLVAYGSISRRHARGFTAATGMEMPPSDIRLVEYLSGREPVSTTSVAEALRIDLTQASRQLGQLADAGHISRWSDPADRRRTLVALTETMSRSLDAWLLHWAGDYQDVVRDWPATEQRDLTRWFRTVQAALESALPGRPSSVVADRWRSMVAGEPLTSTHIDLVSTTIALVAWVAQSGGYNDLLEAHRAPIRQLEYFTLRVVSQHGPMPVAEVAARMAVDPSQASKRLSQLTVLGLVDRSTDHADRRSTLVRVSRKGAALERRIQRAQLVDFTGILEPVSVDDRNRWTQLMAAYLHALAQYGRAEEPAMVRALS
jgi:DNA-binding MarR family transcriptional regulator